METPKKKNISATSKFEDSPVSNYFVNLSPIGPIKSIYNDYALNSLTFASSPSVESIYNDYELNSLTFASPPSVLTSPQIGSHKETRPSTRRHQSLDPSKSSEFSQSGNENDTSKGASFTVQLECFMSASSVGKLTAKQCEMGEIGDLKETDQASATLSNTLLDKLFVSDSSDKVDGKGKSRMNFGCKLQLGPRRHCSIRKLVFETAGAHKRKSTSDSNSSSLVQCNTGSSYSSSMLPGIGLRLNALASTSNEGQNPRDRSSSTNNLERDLVPCNNEAQVTEDAPQTSPHAVGEVDNIRKRYKSENAGESKACKRCNCKKSKCLKLYCECFAAGLYCVEPCSCQDCFNKPSHEEIVLETRRQIESRNPHAFAPKVIRGIDAVPKFGDETYKTPASARHKRGCNCRKSNCLKKYCECFQSGVGCSIDCRCQGCKNTFGRKDDV